MGVRERILGRLGMKDRLSVEQCLEIGKWSWAKAKAKTADDFAALAVHYLDPLGKDRIGIGDYSPGELSRAVTPVAKRFAQEAGTSQEVIKALGEK